MQYAVKLCNELRGNTWKYGDKNPALEWNCQITYCQGPDCFKSLQIVWTWTTYILYEGDIGKEIYTLLGSKQAPWGEQKICFSLLLLHTFIIFKCSSLWYCIIFHIFKRFDNLAIVHIFLKCGKHQHTCIF